MDSAHSDAFVYGLRTYDEYLNPKLITKYQVYFPMKCPKSSRFCRNNGYLIENHELGTQMCVENPMPPNTP